jgi:L-malate glycosyltransferase
VVTDKRSVLIATPVLLVGGTEIQTLNLVNVLVGGDYKVKVCCYYEYDESMVRRFESAGAEVLLMNYERAQGLWHLAKGLIKLFKQVSPAIIHVQYMAPGFVPVIAARLAGIKTVYATVHQPGRIYGIKEKLLLRTAAGFCNAFFCVSRSVEESWFGDSELFDPQKGRKGRRHFTVYNGVDVEKIGKIVEEADSHAIKKSFGIDGRKVVGVVGRLREEKGQTVLLDSMAEIIKTIPDALLLVIGDGPDRISLELRAKSLGIDNNIMWLGQKRPEEVYQLYRTMDVVAVPSFFEGFGLAATEAMAAGLPVVGTRVDGLTEIIDDGASGHLVEAGNSRELSVAIVNLLSNPGEAKTMGMKGRDIVLERFSSERSGKTLLGIYQTAFNRG